MLIYTLIEDSLKLKCSFINNIDLEKYWKDFLMLCVTQLSGTQIM